MSQQNVNTPASESKESSVLKTKPVRRPAKAKADKAAAVAVEQALEKIEIEMIPLSRLAISPLNVRNKVYVQSRIESLAATIKNVGLLHNLIAHDMPDGVLGVACGGRRLTAMQLLLAQGVYQPDQLIPVKRVSEELARAASMVENGEREDMHPAEQIAGFQALADEGKTPAQIGDLMGYGWRHVQRCLKLSGLAPAILDELAADKITIEQCQALTLADSHERQVEVWDQASSYYNPSADTIRNLITSSETEISRSHKFAFLGKDAYVAAGGTIRADLFSGEDDGYIDTALVESLTLEKLQQIAEAVKKEEGFTESEADALFCTRLFRPWEEVSEARWMDQLTVLPPLDWHSSPAGETFKCCEMYSGKVTHIFAHIRGRYFECRDYAWKKHANLVLGAVLAMAAENAH